MSLRQWASPPVPPPASSFDWDQEFYTSFPNHLPHCFRISVCELCSAPASSLSFQILRQNGRTPLQRIQVLSSLGRVWPTICIGHPLGVSYSNVCRQMTYPLRQEGCTSWETSILHSVRSCYTLYVLADLGSNKHHGNIDSWRTQVYPREAGVWPSGRTRESGPGGEGERTEGDGEIGLVWD